MINELYKYFTTDNSSGKKCTESWLSKNNSKLYELIISWCANNNLAEIPFKVKVYHYINDLKSIPKCKVCQSDVKYKRISDGYSQYCSNKCVKDSKEYYLKWRESFDRNDTNKIIEKRNNTLKLKYGEDAFKSIQSIRENSILNKYGVRNVFQIDSIKKERGKILKEKYGSENFNNTDKTRDTRIKNKTQIDDSMICEFKNYKKIAINRTLTIYRNNFEIINPGNYKRCRKGYHIDHMFSIKQGFLNKVPISIITHPCNLQMIHYKSNLKKQDNCCIDLKDLLDKISKFDIEIRIISNIIKNEYRDVKNLAISMLNNMN